MESYAPRPTTLDEWYLRINSIYFDRNFYRTTESILCHLVEVIGGLSLVASGKVRPDVDQDQWVDSFLAKSIGWWMVLCGRVGVRSATDLIWLKFPAVCPYCRLSPHTDRACEKSRRESRHPDWNALAGFAGRNDGSKPETFRALREMFGEIYDRSNATSQQRNFSRLAEELGELAEAVRVLPVTRSYFLSEAADVFAWLMGVANQLEADDINRPLADRRWHDQEEQLDRILWAEYPGQCRFCGSPSCKCAPIPTESRGRIAHEGPHDPGLVAGMLFTPAQAMEVFRVGDSVIINGNGVFIRDIRRDLATLSDGLRNVAKDIARSEDARRAELISVSDRIAQVHAKDTEIQAQVDDVRQLMSELPSEARTALLSYITNMGAGAWLQWLLFMLGVK